MAEIKFTTERMKEVHNRIGEIVSQLDASINSSNELLTTISKNVQSDKVKNTVTNFVKAANEKAMRTKANLSSLDEYLVGKILAYTSVDQSGVDSLNEVQNLLNQLDV